MDSTVMLLVMIQEKIGGLIGANVSIGHTLKYVQPDFKTILETQLIKSRLESDI